MISRRVDWQNVLQLFTVLSVVPSFVAAAPPLAIELESVASGLISPVGLTHAGDGSGRLFVVDQAGFVRVIDGGVLLPTPFLDLTSKLPALGGFFDERGLLGLAFHPDYENNGRFFVRYSAPRAGDPNEPCNDPGGFIVGCHSEVLAEYAVSPGDPNVADPSSEIILFSADEPQFNHNSGAIAFGPDGLLYWGLGDGGGANDGLDDPDLPHGPEGNGQNTQTALGSILRIDVDAPPDPGLPYAIPPTNPFADGVDGLPEIFAYGFRNPFTFAFDDGTGGSGDFYVGDVGQDLFEEISVVVNGGNYGWVIREAFHCFDPFNPSNPPAVCDTIGPFGEPLLDPVLEYLQPFPCAVDADCAPLGETCGSNGLCTNEGGISVIVGGAYRGSADPVLSGRLIFGDFSDDFIVPGGRLYYADTTGPEAFERRQFCIAPNNDPLDLFLKGMGRDEEGEIYALVSSVLGPTGDGGEVLRIVNASGGDCNANDLADACEPDSDNDGTIDECDGCPNDPNKTDPGACGCGVSDLPDADQDGVPDCIDVCPDLDDAFAPDCNPAIPTVSGWGILVLTLILLVLAKLCFRHSEAVA